METLSDQEMTEKEYEQAVAACLQEARGGGEQWNQRFVNALAAHKLKLVPVINDLPPTKDFYRQAPQPFSVGLPVWPASYIEEELADDA
jgi:ABC-type branched-subunit amino acid transport system substrate-binding protein